MVLFMAVVFSVGSVANAADHKVVIMELKCAPLGSIAYTFGNAMQELLAKEHPWLRITNAEGPGSSAVTYRMINDKSWVNTIGCTSMLDYSYANLGVKPYFEKPTTAVRDDIRILFNFLYGAIGLLTRDPKIKTAEDLAGKTIGLGRRGQAHWGGIPTMMFQYGLPDVKFRIEYLGPPQAHEALVDGRVEACSTQVVVTPDGKNAFLPGVVKKLFATRKDIYLVGFTDKTFQNARKAGVIFDPMKMSKDLISDAASNTPVNWVFSPATISVNKNFPEEIAYEFTKFVINNTSRLPEYHAMLNVISTPKKLLGPWKAESLHPGAIRAFKEAGILP
jgi:TRAP transporter TAXI family solute receptor